jgi:hypothetical protein
MITIACEGEQDRAFVILRVGTRDVRAVGMLNYYY